MAKSALYPPQIFEANTVVFALLAAVGAVTLLRILYRVLSGSFRAFVKPGFSYKRHKGEWAVVTGASYGIGAGYCRQLAKRGLNVVLMARSKEKMDEVASAIEKYNIKTKVIPFDFGAAGPKEWEQLATTLAPLKPSVLVNNVGVNVELPTDFLDTDPALVDRMVNINITSVNKITRILLPGMMERKKGIVIFLSSASRICCPMLSVYAGTKAYLDAFAVSLAAEVKKSRVLVSTVNPFFVVSEMSKRKRASLLVPSAEKFASLSLDRVGEVRSCPYWVHAAVFTLMSVVPLGFVSSKILNMHRGIRARLLKRLAQAKKAE
eukprot:jgi/Mesvir1/19201/Mv11516-RA.1